MQQFFEKCKIKKGIGYLHQCKAVISKAKNEKQKLFFSKNSSIFSNSKMVGKLNSIKPSLTAQAIKNKLKIYKKSTDEKQLKIKTKVFLLCNTYLGRKQIELMKTMRKGNFSKNFQHKIYKKKK